MSQKFLENPEELREFLRIANQPRKSRYATVFRHLTHTELLGPFDTFLEAKNARFAARKALRIKHGYQLRDHIHPSELYFRAKDNSLYETPE